MPGCSALEKIRIMRAEACCQKFLEHNHGQGRSGTPGKILKNKMSAIRQHEQGGPWNQLFHIHKLLWQNDIPVATHNERWRLQGGHWETRPDYHDRGRHEGHERERRDWR